MKFAVIYNPYDVYFSRGCVFVRRALTRCRQTTGWTTVLHEKGQAMIGQGGSEGRLGKVRVLTQDTRFYAAVTGRENIQTHRVVADVRIPGVGGRSDESTQK